jgi:hypothetical protein
MDDKDLQEPGEDSDRDVEDMTPEEKAAKGIGGGEDRNPQEGTDNETIDTGEHSDAPGPFGTG